MNTNQVISNFELLFGRIAPLRGTDPNSGANSISRRVVQAHFLSITNLEYKRPVYFSVSYITNNYTPDNVNRELLTTPSANFSLVYDGNALNNTALTPTEYSLATTTIPPFPFRSYTTLKTTNLVVNPGETALLALFPNFASDLANVSPALEIRGHLCIRQEANGVTLNNLESNPYIHEPANVLVCSEHRGTFLDNDYNGVNVETSIFGSLRFGLDFDQLSYALPLAQGKSLYILDGA